MHLLPFERGFNAAPSPPGAFRVALVAMPFGMPTARPSIQLGLLRAIATRAGFPTDTHHLYLDLAARITPRILDHLCEHMGHLLAEWLFSLAAFGEDVSADDREFFTAFPEEVDWAKRIGEDATFLSSLRHEVLPAYIEDCLNQVDWGRYQVVGFTSCFQQNVASLALARLIKERFPQVAIVFGGANWDGEMGVEYCRAFPFVDYAVVGEGDRTFPALLRSLATTGRCDQVRGVVRRDADGVQFNGRSPLVQDLDELPTPDYDEYFQRARRLGLLRPGESAEVLPFEGSRGCWWGQKHHCTFCGLNGLGMAFRTKSPQRALAELSELARRHRSCFFSATDNILDMKYVKDFFAVIHQAKADFQFFYEVKSNLTREQLRTLYLGGVRYLQPGIESLSTHVLQLMRKGCTMLQNVRLLKWCRYLQIGVGWNLLRGFPGETVEDYRRQLEVLKQISHLQPPELFQQIRVDRFSPFFKDRDLFPIENIRPLPCYRHVYPPRVNLDRIACFFDHHMNDTAPEEVLRPTREWVEEWQRRWSSGRPDSLTYWRTPEALFIEDQRGDVQGRLCIVEGPMALAYEYCSDTMRTVAQVKHHLQTAAPGDALEATEILELLEDFCAKGLMLSEDGRYFSLATPLSPSWWSAD